MDVSTGLTLYNMDVMSVMSPEARCHLGDVWLLILWVRISILKLINTLIDTTKINYLDMHHNDYKNCKERKRSEIVLKHGRKLIWFCMVLPHININSSIVCPGAHRYFCTDQSGTGTGWNLFSLHTPNQEVPWDQNIFFEGDSAKTARVYKVTTMIRYKQQRATKK